MKRIRTCIIPAAAGLLFTVATSAWSDTAAVLKPQRVYQLGSSAGVAANDARPRWSPDGSMLSFERSTADRQELVISSIDGTVVKIISHRAGSGSADAYGLNRLLPGISSDRDSFNAALSWSADGHKMVFMSNAGKGNYDLYLGRLETEQVDRLTRDAHKDGQPDWHPQRDELVFVSGRDGGARVWHMDLRSRQLRALTSGAQTWLYPRWSPDGGQVVAMYGDSGDHNIYIIDARGGKEARALTRWRFDDISPSWSPDGKYVAFYSNYNEDDNPHRWSIIVLAVDGSDGADPEVMKARVVAADVQPDVDHGPAWSPDGRYIAYVRRERQDYNPIFIADLKAGQQHRFETGTRMNRDISFSAQGRLAFRAQVEQWDRIFVAEPGRLEP